MGGRGDRVRAEPGEIIAEDGRQLAGRLAGPAEVVEVERQTFDGDLRISQLAKLVRERRYGGLFTSIQASE